MRNKLIFGIVLFISAIMLMPPMYNQNAFADEIDLNTWNQEGNPSNGRWAVSEDGSSVFQSINGNPTMFVSPDSVINAAIGGTIKVETTGDDDWIGFVMGFGEDHTDEFILFDWKQLPQGTPKGFTLAKVTGGTGAIPFGNHDISKAGYEVLATNSEFGWLDNTSYDIIIEYNSNRIVVKVFGGQFGDDGVIVIDVEGEFSEGRFGFYNFSQTNVRYSGFVDDPEPLTKKSGGGDNQWDTRPSFGISHETRQDQIVENGFSFNSEYFTVTDNHHTDFAEQSVGIGTVNSFSATVWADKGLKVQEFLFGIPNVGEAHLAELGIEVWYDFDGEIQDVIVVQKTDVIDADTVSVSHEMTKCLSTDAEARCDTTTVSMTFLEPLLDKVMAIKAIDWKNRDQRTFLNEGFDISGESLNPMLSNMIPSSVRDEGLLKVTQVAKYSPLWTTEDGRIFEMNSFGSFKQTNQSFERFQDTGTAFTRMHSGFGGIIAYEQNKALDIFDASNLFSELPESFAYIYPETGQRITEEMRQTMLLQEEIAKAVLDEMDKQDRHY
jgi:hypothetical protein